ncbi:hypothetical protein HAX39_23470 [Citrobacter freundii]|nr:hypothetical protein [Citrobacter freundii]
MLSTRTISSCTRSHLQAGCNDISSPSHDRWKDWEREAAPGSGEQREMATERMKQCLKDKSDLNLLDVPLSSLPPDLPPCKTLRVDEKHLDELVSRTIKNNYADNILMACIDNFVYHKFEDILDLVSHSEQDFVREEVFFKKNLESGLGDDWCDFYERLVNAYEGTSVPTAVARTYLTECFKQNKDNNEYMQVHFNAEGIKNLLTDFMSQEFQLFANTYGDKVRAEITSHTSHALKAGDAKPLS